MKCRFCGAELAESNRYCPGCGQRVAIERVMPHEVPAKPAFTPAPVPSAAVAVLDERARPTSTAGQESADSPDSSAPHPAEALYIDPVRLLCMSLVSGGAYSFYWMFLTWKQLRSETHDDHHAIWHAFAVNVPIYGWFRAHKHFEVIRDLSMGVGLVPSFIPIMVVFLYGLGLGVEIFVGTLGLDTIATVVVHIVGVVFTVALLVWVQNDLNRYWQRTRGDSVDEIGFGVGEILLTLLGAASWLVYL